jgi:hypothetical protein
MQRLAPSPGFALARAPLRRHIDLVPTVFRQRCFRHVLALQPKFSGSALGLCPSPFAVPGLTLVRPRWVSFEASFHLCAQGTKRLRLGGDGSLNLASVFDAGGTVPSAKPGAAPTTGSAFPSFMRANARGLDFPQVRVCGHKCKPKRSRSLVLPWRIGESSDSDAPSDFSNT